ncbi:hypothetical protein PG989_006423 [Apiospora arundinis]
MDANQHKPGKQDTVMPSSSAFNRDEALARMAERIANVQTQNPDQDLKLSSQWWTPVVDIEAQMKVSSVYPRQYFDRMTDNYTYVAQELDAETAQKVNDATRKVLENQFDPAVLHSVREQLHGLLAAKHEDLFQTIESTVFANQGALGGLRQHIQQTQAEGGGNVAFPTCMAPKGN